MRCPYCSDPSNRVVDSREAGEGQEIRRRRQCDECGRRFTTRERVEDVQPKIVKHDERREEFRRDKLLASIQKAWFSDGATRTGNPPRPGRAFSGTSTTGCQPGGSPGAARPAGAEPLGAQVVGDRLHHQLVLAPIFIGTEQGLTAIALAGGSRQGIAA